VLFVMIISLSPLTLTTHDITFSIAHAADDGSVWSQIGDAAGSATSWALSNTIGVLFNKIVGWLFYLPLLLAGMYLSITGGIFDWLLNNTVLGFSEMYSEYFSTGVDLTWVIFRDVGNIVMIAMFVFIAFSVILNSTSFGLKQFGVRILIVAVLLNFSLFFTKVVIDISNVTAIQFAKEISRSTNSSSSELSISSKFMEVGGFSAISTGEPPKDGDATAKTSQETANAIQSTLLGTIFLTAAASILLSASILLVTRVITFIFLMIMSPLAFVAYMTPNMEGWWTMWWKYLLKNAIFAPLFMLLLLAVIRLVDVPSSKSPLGSGSVLDPEAYFHIAVVLGLFYGATKLASSLSLLGAETANKYGMGAFGRVAQLLTGASLVKTVGRNTLGRWGANNMDDKELRRKAIEGNFAQRMMARGQLSAANKAAKATYDFRDTKIAKNLEKASGVTFGAASKKSFDSFLNKEANYLGNARVDEKKAQEEAGKTVRGNGPQTEAPKTKEGSEASAQPKAELVKTPEAPKKPEVPEKTTPPETEEVADSSNKIKLSTAGEDIDSSKKEADEKSRERSDGSIKVNNIKRDILDLANRDVIDIRSNKDENLEDVGVVLNRPGTESAPTSRAADQEKGSSDEVKNIIKEYRDKTGKFAEGNVASFFGRTKKSRSMIADRAEKIAGKTNEEKLFEDMVKEKVKEATEGTATDSKGVDKDTKKA